MAKHIAQGTPTQVAHPVRATLRTAVAYILAGLAFLAATIPIIQEVAGDYLPEDWKLWLASALGVVTMVASLITRLMAVAKAQRLLDKIGLGAGATEDPDSVVIPRAQLEGWRDTPPLTGDDWRRFAESLPGSEQATSILSVADALDRKAKGK